MQYIDWLPREISRYIHPKRYFWSSLKLKLQRWRQGRAYFAMLLAPDTLYRIASYYIITEWRLSNCPCTWIWVKSDHALAYIVKQKRKQSVLCLHLSNDVFSKHLLGSRPCDMDRLECPADWLCFLIGPYCSGSQENACCAATNDVSSHNFRTLRINLMPLSENLVCEQSIIE